MPQNKTEIENPPVSIGAEKSECYVHEKPEEWQKPKIRENVCVNDLPLKKHTDGEHYCLFHLPTKVKDIVKFEQIFNARLKAVKQKVDENEKLPEDKKADAKHRLRYNFQQTLLEIIYFFKISYINRLEWLSKSYSQIV